MEYNRRPQNIDVNECGGVSYYKKGEFAKALPHIESALKTHCKNPNTSLSGRTYFIQNQGICHVEILLGEALEKYPLIPFFIKN
jgi:hypothetical protein